MKHCLLFFIVLFIPFVGESKEPTIVNLSSSGTLNWIYYDFSSESNMHPLTGIYLSGSGKVMCLRIQARGYSFLVNEFGEPLNIIQGPFQVDWDNNHKIERFKQEYDSFMRFYYDYNGRLEKIKNGNYDVEFALSYDTNGRLDRIDQGGVQLYCPFLL